MGCMAHSRTDLTAALDKYRPRPGEIRPSHYGVWAAMLPRGSRYLETAHALAKALTEGKVTDRAPDVGPGIIYRHAMDGEIIDRRMWWGSLHQFPNIMGQGYLWVFSVVERNYQLLGLLSEIPGVELYGPLEPGAVLIPRDGSYSLDVITPATA